MSEGKWERWECEHGFLQSGFTAPMSDRSNWKKSKVLCSENHPSIFFFFFKSFAHRKIHNDAATKTSRYNSGLKPLSYVKSLYHSLAFFPQYFANSMPYRYFGARRIFCQPFWKTWFISHLCCCNCQLLAVLEAGVSAQEKIHQRMSWISLLIHSAAIWL